MGNLIFWSKLGSTLEVTSPEIGGAGTVVGSPTFQTAKFDNGIYSNSVSNYAYFNQVPNEAKGTVEFWIKINESSASLPNGTARMLYNIDSRQAGAGADIGRIMIYFRKTVAGTPYFTVYTNFINVDYSMTWTSGDLIHVAYTWDTAGATNKNWIYVNGVLVYQTTTAPSFDWHTYVPYSYVVIQSYPLQNPAYNTVDNIKFFDYAKTDFSDRNTEDAGAPSTEPPIEEPTPPTLELVPQPLPEDISPVIRIMSPEANIYHAGVDIYAKGYVKDLTSINEKKTFRKDKLVSNQISVPVKNFDNFFSTDNPDSYFGKLYWYGQPFVISDVNGDIVWNGIIKDIIRDHNKKMATIISINKLYLFSQTKVDYESSNWETPAQAFQNICNKYEFYDYDFTVLNNSHLKYVENNCYIKVNINPSDDCTFQQALEKLGEVGCADVFSHLNKVYFHHFDPDVVNIKFSLTEKDLLKLPVVSTLEKELINEYSIGYEGMAEDQPATDSNSNNIAETSRLKYGTHALPEINGTTGSDMKFKDSTSAIYIGECYIRRTHKNITTEPKPLQKIDFMVSLDYQNKIDLLTNFRLTLSDEGWTDKIFEVFGTTFDYAKNTIRITAYEVTE